MSAPQPIFVVALPKSYTSVFSGMVGQHPDLMTTPELNLFVGDTVQDWGTQTGAHIFCDGLIRTVAQLHFGAQTIQTARQATDWLEARSSWSVKQMMDNLREAAAPAAIIDQSPIYMQKPRYLRRVFETYPKARFIHLTRNPVSWVKSMHNWGVFGQEILDSFIEDEIGLNAPPAPIDLWHAAYFGIQNLLSDLDPKQHIHVMGEDVVTRPRETMKRVAEWLDLPSDEAVIDGMLHPENSMFAGWGPFGARGGNNPDFLTDPRLRTRDDRDKIITVDTSQMALSGEVTEMATQLGYQI